MYTTRKDTQSLNILTSKVIRAPTPLAMHSQIQEIRCESQTSHAVITWSVVIDPMNVGSRIVNFIVNFIRDGTVFA